MAEITIIPAKNQSLEIVRTAAYARVSSDSEDQLNSFAAQIRYYTELLKNSTDAVLVDMYADEGITGTSAAKRPDFQRLMSDCRKGKIDRILTKSVSRFARNTTECLAAVRELKALGISVYFEKEDIETAEISTEMLLTLYSQFAQEESISISKNVRMGIQKRMQDGTYVPSSKPFGYVKGDNGLEINEAKAEVVQAVFADFLHGASEATISVRYGIGIATVKYILRNEKYTGDSMFHKWYTTDTLPFKCVQNNGEREMYLAQGTHQAIISKDDFQKAQELLEQKGRQHRGKSTVSCPLRKKIFCGVCGTLFKRKERGNRTCWVCRNHDQSTNLCPVKQIDETEFELAFIALFNNLKLHCAEIISPMYRQLQRLADLGESANTQVAEIRREIADQKEQSYLLAQLNSQGIIEPVYFAARSQELDRNLVQLQNRLHSMLDGEDDDRLDNLRKLISVLEKAELITGFDEDKFGSIVEKITVLSESEIRFELFGGVGFNEQIQRKGR
ncbi:MAG: recombinase family protein [Oscillospiraceae bacterium]|nr:recombinase family protein [Oscillospiraceae bacterium]